MGSSLRAMLGVEAVGLIHMGQCSRKEQICGVFVPEVFQDLSRYMANSTLEEN